ncbi:hypothetical protein C1646_773049, partial [Rhizophagus diaphanus]
VDGSIDDQLQDAQIIAEELNHVNEDDVITRTFIPFLPSTLHEDVAIKNALDHMQNENNPIT